MGRLFGADAKPSSVRCQENCALNHVQPEHLIEDMFLFDYASWTLNESLTNLASLALVEASLTSVESLLDKLLSSVDRVSRCLAASRLRSLEFD